MSEYLRKRWEAERLNLLEQLRAIHHDAEEAKRDITPDERAEAGRISDAMNNLHQQERDLKKTEDDNAALAEAFRNAGVKQPETAAPVEDTASKVRSFLRGEIRSVDVKPEERALSVGTPTAGGNTVPQSYYDQIVQHMVEVSGVLMSGPTVWNTDSGESFNVPTTTTHGAAALTTEGNTISQSDPAITRRTLGAYKFAQLILLSTELLSDTAVDLSGYLAQAAGRNLGIALAPYLVTGTGSSQPAGIVTGASSGVTGGLGVSGAFTYTNLVNLYHSVIAPYRNHPSAGWILKDSSLAAVRLLVDGAGRFIFEPGVAGQPDAILGKQVHTDFSVAATALNAKSVVFGDISTFWVRYAGGVRFERSVDRYFDTDQVAFRAIIRADSILVDQTGAVKYFAGGAS